MDCSSIEHWRNYFRTATGDIFQVIENAITIAGLDYPKDFRIRRDRIVEKLFLCQLNRCAECDRLELAAQKDNDDECTKLRSVDNSVGFEGKERKVNTSVKDGGDCDLKYTSNYSYHEAEALTAEIEEESQIVREVLRIKELLTNIEDKSEDVIIESLRRLKLMSLSVETLEATKIGMAVGHLRKHTSKCICNFARTLIKEWKVLVEQWIRVVPDIKGEVTPDSANPSVVEEGLPSPPLDEGAFLSTQTSSVELSLFFEGMDDDGNPRNSGEFTTNRENVRKPTSQNPKIKIKKMQPPNEVNTGTKENEGQDMRKKDSVNKQFELSNNDVRPARPPKIILRHRVNDETKLRQEHDTVHQKLIPSGQQDDSKCSNNETDQMKLEAAKRKLHKGYQQAENAKKQRTVQVMELHELPKQGLEPGNPRMRPGSNNRTFSNGR